jgi:hypothetical protein
MTADDASIDTLLTPRPPTPTGKLACVTGHRIVRRCRFWRQLTVEVHRTCGARGGRDMARLAARVVALGRPSSSCAIPKCRVLKSVEVSQLLVREYRIMSIVRNRGRHQY